MPLVIPTSPSRRIVALQARQGSTDVRTPQPGRCPLYVTLGRESTAGARTPARVALVPYRTPRPEPTHPAVRLLGLVLVLACLALLWQFGQLLERDGVFAALREVTR